MMKKLMFLFLGLSCLMAKAVPADPTPIRVAQPDGTMLTVVLHGDEFTHYNTTQDGYTIVKNKAGFYTYATVAGGHLVAGDRIARDVAHRTAADRAALANVPKGLTDPSKVRAGAQMKGRRNAAMHRVGADGTMDYDNFRGLIILINYTDMQFSMNDANGFYDAMVNTHDFKGYQSNHGFVSMTGSVRDYYYDNSNHIFDPVFDIVGPVDVPYTCTFPQGTNNSGPVFSAALMAVDDLVDFSDYDTDGDGYVDMVFFLVAGYSANYSGNNQNYLWPHMYYLWQEPMRDGVGFWLYACSTEIAGWEGYYADVNGIGTFCHEFGHVLGLPDLYDTDYSGSGGESRNPGEWSIMAGGSGNNFGRNPVGYSLYERYALGFTTPELIEADGVYSLQALDQSNTGYRLNTPTQDEYFLIENRQAGKWDRYLPGHGMMIARVDSTNARIWEQNEVNCNPSRMYYDLLRARYSGQDSGSDPFPGTSGVTSITNFTTPNLRTWDGKFNDFSILNITESNRIITFEAKVDTSIVAEVEDFELMPVTDDLSAKGVQGVYSKWDFTKCAVKEYTKPDGTVGHGVAMKKPSQLTTSAPLEAKPYSISFTVYNPSSMAANFRLTYSTDNGETWLGVTDGTISAKANDVTSLTANLPIDEPIMLRINQTSGSCSVSCYLDDIKINYTDKWPAQQGIPGDVNGDGEVNIADVNVVINVILNGGTTDADLFKAADVNGDGEVNISDVNTLIQLIISHPADA